jgi:hypothetical protein
MIEIKVPSFEKREKNPQEIGEKGGLKGLK